MKNYKFAEITATNGQIYRTEKIDLVNNEIFKNLKTSQSIKRAYQNFWGNEIQVTEIKFINN
ncbi:MAG: hypothetical protein WCH21_09855 [Bacteroidota bacterium]